MKIWHFKQWLHLFTMIISLTIVSCMKEASEANQHESSFWRKKKILKMIRTIKKKFSIWYIFRLNNNLNNLIRRFNEFESCILNAYVYTSSLKSKVNCSLKFYLKKEKMKKHFQSTHTSHYKHIYIYTHEKRRREKIEAVGKTNRYFVKSPWNVMSSAAWITYSHERNWTLVFETFTR